MHASTRGTKEITDFTLSQRKLTTVTAILLHRQVVSQKPSPLLVDSLLPFQMTTRRKRRRRTRRRKKRKKRKRRRRKRKRRFGF